MEDKKFFEEVVIENLEKFNVFSKEFIEAYHFFYENYDYELPESYKTKLFTVLKNNSRVNKDLAFMIYNLKKLELKDINSYLKKLEKFIADEFNLAILLNVKDEDPVESKEQEIILHYTDNAKKLLEYFSTKVSVKIENSFLKELKESGKVSKISSSTELNVNLNSFEIEEIVLSIDEVINDEFNY